MEAGLAKFGDADAAIELVKEVGKGSHLGRILGNGAGMTQGLRRGAGAGGEEPGNACYDPRAVQGIGVTLRDEPMARITRQDMLLPRTC